MAHPYHHHRAEEVAKAHAHIRKTGHKGFARGGHVHEDAAEDAKEIERGVHEHESNMHKGEPKTKLKLKDGGCVEGEGAKHHMAHRARGGKTGKGGKHTKVNVIIAPQGGGGGMHPPMMPARPPMAGGPPPGAPPPGAGGPPPMPPPAMTRPGMGMPGAGGPPMGGPPPGMMRAKGGRIPHMEAGAGSGEGRLEKVRAYGKRD